MYKAEKTNSQPPITFTTPIQREICLVVQRKRNPPIKDWSRKVFYLSPCVKGWKFHNLLFILYEPKVNFQILFKFYSFLLSKTKILWLLQNVMYLLYLLFCLLFLSSLFHKLHSAVNFFWGGLYREELRIKSWPWIQ